MMLKELLREVEAHPEGSPAWRRACGRLLWELGGEKGYKRLFDLDLLHRCLGVAEGFKREDIITELEDHLREVEALFEKLKPLTIPADIVEAVLSSRLIASDAKLAEEVLSAFWGTHEVSSKDRKDITDTLSLRTSGEGVKGLFLSGGVGVVKKVYLYVSYDGSGQITCGNRAGESLERAGRNGVAAALRYLEEVAGKEIRCDVHWQVEGVGDEYEGSSVGLAVAVGVVWSYLKQIGVEEGDISRYAFTGAVEVDGRIGKVGGIEAKARAAKSDGEIDFMVYPSGCSVEITEGLVRCKFLPCGHLREAVEAIWGDDVGNIGKRVILNRRTISALIGALVGTVGIVVLLWWLEAFSWAEVGIEGMLLKARRGLEANKGVGVDGRSSIDVPIVIVSIDDRSVKELGDYGPTWREHYSRLVDVLARGGARAIGFDICFEGASKWDEGFAYSLKEAKVEGAAVVLGIGCSIEDGKPVLPPEAIKESASGLGSIYLGQVLGVVRKAQVAIPQWHPKGGAFQPLQVPAVPSFDLQLLAGGQAKDSRLSLSEWKVYSSSMPPIPVDREGYIHIDFGQGEFQRVSYIDVLSGRFAPSFFLKKTVLVGAEFSAYGKKLDYYLTPLGRMYGVEVHAHAMATILRGRYMRSLEGGVLRTLWVGLWALSMIFLSLMFIRWRLLILALEAIALVLISSYLFLSFDLLLDIVYPLLGAGIAFWWSGRMIARRGGFFKSPLR
jgi:CHASE2 domain-containing sensor protein